MVDAHAQSPLRCEQPGEREGGDAKTLCIPTAGGPTGAPLIVCSCPAANVNYIPPMHNLTQRNLTDLSLQSLVSSVINMFPALVCTF